jgi:hypothetical protein
MRADFLSTAHILESIGDTEIRLCPVGPGMCIAQC